MERDRRGSCWSTTSSRSRPCSATPCARTGYEVVAAHDGREALERFAEKRFDLVVLDIMLPKLDGIEVCRRLRGRSQVPIIMLTAKDDEGDKVLGLEMGADDYITKPFSVREFRSRVKAALRRSEMLSGRPGGEPIVAGEIAIDFERRSVVARGEEATLTYVEFELLATLAGSPGRVMTREMLLEQIWGDSAYRDPRTIDVHVRHLREKLEADPRKPEYVLTVRGVGYRFQGVTSMNSVRNRLALLFFVITAAAVGFIYLYVVPQLRIEPDGREAAPPRDGRGRARARRIEDAMHRGASPQRVLALVREIDQRTGARVTVLGGPRRASPGDRPAFVVADSELERAAAVPDYPAAATRPPAAERTASAVEGVGGERLGQTAVPLIESGRARWVAVFSTGPRATSTTTSR